MARVFLAVLVLAAAAAARASIFHVTNLDDDGTGSLRWAVDQANHSGGADKIVFDVAGTIHSTSPIQTTEQVFIDANFAVTLAATGASPAALILNSIVTRVRGLAVSNTGGDGIIMRGDADWVESCHVGPNSGNGIRIEGTNDSVTATTIVASENGIGIANAFGTSIYGCFIGLEPETHVAGGNRGDGIHVDALSDAIFIGGIRTTCVNNCVGFVKPQNVVANSGGVGIRIEGTTAHVLWNQVVDNAGDGIVHAATAARSEYIDNWLARNGGNGLTILGSVDNVLANTGTCNTGLLLDYGGDGLSAPDASALQGAPNRPELTAAERDAETTSVSGKIDAAPFNSYVVMFHPQKSENCPIEEQPFDWNPDTITVQTDINGRATFNAVVPAHGESAILATITAPGGKKMSEPSATIAVVPALFRNIDVAVSTVPSAQSSGGGNVILTFTTTVTNRGTVVARDVVVSFTPPPLAAAPPTDAAGTSATIGSLTPGVSVVLRQSFLWPIGTGPVRYEARVTHDQGADADPSNDVSVVIYPPRRRAVR
jgi:hypothetical protein